MLSPTDLLLANLKEEYDSQVASRGFTRLYDDPTFGYMFAVLHQRLNKHFVAINDRAKTTQHYWADPSRDLIALIEELNQDLHDIVPALR
ncbi:MAG: hypothetical protein ACOH1T_08595 [Microbacteriaceae bacterium]